MPEGLGGGVAPQAGGGPADPSESEDQRVPVAHLESRGLEEGTEMPVFVVRLVKEEARERRGGRDPMETGGRRGGTAFQASRGWAVSLATAASPAKEESGESEGGTEFLVKLGNQETQVPPVAVARLVTLEFKDNKVKVDTQAIRGHGEREEQRDRLVLRVSTEPTERLDCGEPKVQWGRPAKEDLLE